MDILKINGYVRCIYCGTRRSIDKLSTEQRHRCECGRHLTWPADIKTMDMVITKKSMSKGKLFSMLFFGSYGLIALLAILPVFSKPVSDALFAIFALFLLFMLLFLSLTSLRYMLGGGVKAAIQVTREGVFITNPVSSDLNKPLFLPLNTKMEDYKNILVNVLSHSLGIFKLCNADSDFMEKLKKAKSENEIKSLGLDQDFMESLKSGINLWIGNWEKCAPDPEEVYILRRNPLYYFMFFPFLFLGELFFIAFLLQNSGGNNFNLLNPAGWSMKENLLVTGMIFYPFVMLFTYYIANQFKVLLGQKGMTFFFAFRKSVKIDWYDMLAMKYPVGQNYLFASSLYFRKPGISRKSYTIEYSNSLYEHYSRLLILTAYYMPVHMQANATLQFYKEAIDMADKKDREARCDENDE